MTVSSGVPPRIQALQRHLRGVRRRLLWVFLSFGLGMSLTWYFRSTILLWLYAPARRYLGETWQPIFTGPTEMLGLAIKLAMWGGIAVAFPVLVYHILRFSWPILRKQQRRFLALCLPAFLLCYLGGASFAYFVMLPAGMGFLLQFGTDVAVPMLRVSEYMDIVMRMIFWLGVVFELPLIMVVVTKLRIMRFRRLWQWNKYVPPFAFILGTIVSPGLDPVTMLLIAVPIILLYEVGLVCAWFARPRT